MTEPSAANLGTYLEFDRRTWSDLRANTPLTLTEAELVALRGLDEQVALAEVAEVYLPLSRLLNLRVAATQHLAETTSTFLGTLSASVPFVIGVAGSVAVGKSTTSRVLQALLKRWPSTPRVEVITTDGFLFPNAVLNERNMMHRKGFPESYDVRRLVSVLHDLKAGAATVEVPMYSHVTYDVADAPITITAPDIVIVEGINVLQVPPTRDTVDDRFVSDYFDFSIYVDATEADICQWYIDRTFYLREVARTDPASFFGFLVPMDDAGVFEFASMIWGNVNGVNLHENIAPTRSRADLILEKGSDHSVANIKLRRR